MPGKRSPDKAWVGGYAPAGMAAWVKAEARRLGRTVTDIVIEALSEYRDKHDPESKENGR